MTVKFITVKGPDRLARAPFYLGIPQHERTMSKREAYEHIALKTGYTSTAVKAVFMAAAEYVALANARGVETKAEITFSDLQNVKAQLATALDPGEYTLKVYTRSGLGDQYGVHVATRKVMVA